MINRTDLTEEARIALEAECMVRRAGLKEVASDLIMAGISERAKGVMVIMGNGKKAEKPKYEKAIPIKGEKMSPLHAPISEEEARIITEMYYTEPRPSYDRIASQIGRKKGTVHRWVKNNLLKEESDER